MKNKKKIVAYHGACLDGSSAAAVFKMRYPEAVFYPIKSRIHTEIKDAILQDLKKGDAELFVLDNPWFVEDYAKSGVKLTIIDHHKGAFDELISLAEQYENINYIFDDKKSGASLTWSFLFPDKDLPKFIWHIEDVDIWRMEDKYHSDLISTYASIYMDNLDKYIEMINADIEEIYKLAKPVLDYRDALIDYYMRNAQALHLKVGEYKIKAYNVASIRPVISEFGNRISKEVKEPVVMFKLFGDLVNLSFRSASEKWKPLPVDLAQSLGGNGHPLAAGAKMRLQDFLDSLEESNE